MTIPSFCHRVRSQPSLPALNCHVQPIRRTARRKQELRQWQEGKVSRTALARSQRALKRAGAGGSGGGGGGGGEDWGSTARGGEQMVGLDGLPLLSTLIHNVDPGDAEYGAITFVWREGWSHGPAIFFFLCFTLRSADPSPVHHTPPPFPRPGRWLEALLPETLLEAHLVF